MTGLKWTSLAALLCVSAGCTSTQDSATETAVNAARIFLRTAEVKFPSFADLGVALMSPFLADGLGVSGLARVSAGR